VNTSDLVEAVNALEPERVLVGRALDPALRADLAVSMDYEELPFVRGRTVVPPDLTASEAVIAGHPNFFGIFDLPAAPNWIGVTGPWSALVPTAKMTSEVMLAKPLDPAEAEASLTAVRDLAKRVAQVGGISVAFPPQSPVLVVLLSVDAGHIASEMALPGCTPLTGYEELPGGLRIEPDAADRARCDEYAATLAKAMRSAT
jgi:hypothetical protein